LTCRNADLFTEPLADDELFHAEPMEIAGRPCRVQAFSDLIDIGHLKPRP